MNKTFNKITYAKSGVNIKKADKLISNIKRGSNPRNSNVLAGIGGFSSLYSLDLKKYKNPVIVSGTDGVGTKLQIANILNEHRYIGQDLLAMCANDVITSGANPLFFLDYLATSKIDLKLHSTVISGIQKACNSIGIPLIGGETAEMPGMYKKNDYDLAGFCVGVVDKSNIIEPKKIKRGDLIIGFKSSGLHSNGYSLVNKLIENKRLSIKKKYNGMDIKKCLIKPTILYVDLFNILSNKVKINGAAHITGGGITENIPRVIPDKYSANINLKSWIMPNIFKIIQDASRLTDAEMLRTFNCGIGMITIINKKDVEKMFSILNKSKYTPKIIGYIIDRKNNSSVEYV